MSIQDMQQAVERGVALLDEKMPGWDKQIDLGTLDMRECDLCIIGQICGNYSNDEARDDLGIPFFIDAVNHGFNLDRGNYAAEFADLGRVWREAIEQRRLVGTTNTGG